MKDKVISMADFLKTKEQLDKGHESYGEGRGETITFRLEEDALEYVCSVLESLLSGEEVSIAEIMHMYMVMSDQLRPLAKILEEMEEDDDQDV